MEDANDARGQADRQSFTGAGMVILR